MSMLVKLFLLGLVLFPFNIVSAQNALTPREVAILKADAFKLWAKRDMRDSLEEALSKFDLIHTMQPEDAETLVYLTRGNYIMGDAYMTDNEQKKHYFEKAATYGDKALLLNKDFATRMAKENDIEKAVNSLKGADVPAMFWTAASVGKFARTVGIFASLKFKGKILALIKRVEKLQPSYFHGAIPRYWGGYYAVIPSIAGKDLDKSKKYFEKSMQMAPEYLGTKVLMAETYWVEKEDKKEFKKLLTEMIADTKYDNHPEVGPENRLEKAKAERLLSNMDELF